MTARKLAVKKFDGNDTYSYAVFYADEVRGKRSPIFYGEARPLIAGLSKMEAEARKKRIEATMA